MDIDPDDLDDKYAQEDFEEKSFHKARKNSQRIYGGQPSYKSGKPNRIKPEHPPE